MGLIDRRRFLVASGLAAAAAVGRALPASAAQDQARQDGTSQGAAESSRGTEASGEGNTDSKPADQGSAETAKKDPQQDDPYRVTKLDADGKPYRICPQCGSNMYLQDKTWTCEVCGYSYTE